MLARLKRLLSDSGPPAKVEEEDLPLAAAALLAEVALADGGLAVEEETIIEELLAEHFSLPREDAGELMERGRQAAENSVELYGFARRVKDGADEAQRIRLMELLWSVVLVDGRLDDHEASLMRRIAGLIFVADKDSGLARQRALAALEARARPQ